LSFLRELTVGMAYLPCYVWFTDHAKPAVWLLLDADV
jgi:hypothetical protein